MTVGHGCPHVKVHVRSTCMQLPTAGHQYWHRGLRAIICSVSLCGWLVGFAMHGPAFGQVAATTSAVTCELRIVWGGDVQRSYAGTISVDAGTIHAVRNLSLQDDSIANLGNTDLQTLSISPHSPSGFGGVDVNVRGSLTTRLTLRFLDPTTHAPIEFTVQLGELLQGTWVQPLDGYGNRVAIERQMYDRVRVVAKGKVGILEANQPWQFELEGYRTGLSPGVATAELRFVRYDRTVGPTLQQPLNIDADGSFAPIKIEMPAPDQEGAYHLEISLARRGYLKSLVSTSQPLLRRVDLVVFDAEATPLTIAGWQPLAAIDPLKASKPGSLAWLSTFDVLAPLGLPSNLGVPERLQAYNPLSGSLNQPISHGSLGSRKYLLPNPTSGQSESVAGLTLQPNAWLAIPLQGLRGDTPHRLRVRVPTDRPMELALSLQQTNVLGEFPPLSLDSGVIIGPRQAHHETGGEVTEHEVVFWPRGEQVYIVIANLHEEFEASVGDIQLEQAELATSSTLAQTTGKPIAQRMVGIHLDKPLLADCVSAKREIDPVTGRPLESWSTWQESIGRICQLMLARDTNTLVVKGFSEGGAIFPSDRLSPTCRYDSGAFFSDGRAPEIKDAVELMLRHFDRQQLHLILSLDLNTALPALKRFENTEGHESLLQQPLALDAIVSARGTPRYNPLNARVQEEIVAVVREIVNRYGHHSAFAGLAIQLDGQSQLVFAGDRWGYDADTLADFETAVQVKLPPREQLETIFSGSPRLAFLDWRASELSKFYMRLGEVVSAGDPQRKLYLNAIRLWDASPSHSDFVTPESTIRNPREYLLAFGISPEQLAKSPQVELMRGSFDVAQSVNVQDWIRHESGQRGLVEFQSGPDAPALVLRYPRRHQLQSSSKLGGAERWIYPTLSAPGAYARKELIHQIFHADPLLLVDGGWLPFSGQDAGVSSLIRTLGELPPIKLTQVSLQEPNTNLRLRQGSYEGKSYVQIVNNASWVETVRIGYQTSHPNGQPRMLGSRQLVIDTAEAQKQWSLKIPPYEVVALEVDDPRLMITSLQHSPGSDTLELVRHEIDQLDALISQSADLAQQNLLANIQGEFEQWDERKQPLGWSVSSLPQVSIGKSLDLPHTGTSCLLLENRDEHNVSAWAQSRAVKPPRTGRIAVQAWLRAPAVGPPLLVKLAVVGRTLSGERFERALELGARAEGAAPIAIDWGRKPATLFVGDVSGENIAELSVLIELIGPGKVWVDDVQIFESFLQPDERNHLRGQLLVAKQKLNENNPFPAEQLLDSHWGEYLLRFEHTHESSAKVASLADPNNSTTPAPPSPQRTPWAESPSVFRQFRENIRDRWRR